MHRRARHINTRCIGASIYLDARRIKNTSGGTSIQTWTDESGSSNNLTQATSANRPVYQTAVTGGQPAVEFTASSTQSISNTSYTITANSFCVFMVGSSKSATVSGRFVQVNLNDNNDWNNTDGMALLFWRGSDSKISSYRNNAQTTVSGTLSVGNWYSCCHMIDGTNLSLWVNNTKTTSTTTGTFNSNRIVVGRNTTDGMLDGYIGALSLVKSTATESLIKRINHSMAFSWKIDCN